MRGQRILADSMVIVEAHRMGVWNGLIHFFSIETVEECAVECATGCKRREGYVEVDQQSLRSQIQIHEVADAMRAALISADPLAARMDPGEKDLMSYAITQPNTLLLCSPDGLTVKCAHRLNKLDQLVALEEIAIEAGMRKQGFKGNHTKAWLTGYKLDLHLGRK